MRHVVAAGATMAVAAPAPAWGTQWGLELLPSALGQIQAATAAAFLYPELDPACKEPQKPAPAQGTK